jgi:hypothetical protein
MQARVRLSTSSSILVAGAKVGESAVELEQAVAREQ